MSAYKAENPSPEPKPTWKEPARNSYLVKCDGRVAVFRTPLFPVIGRTCFALLPCSQGILMMSAIITCRFPIEAIVIFVIGLGMAWVGICMVLSSGVSEIIFDLVDRTYKRVLLPPPALGGKMIRNLAGAGNPIGRRVIEGEMTEIEGVRLVEGRGKHSRLYSIQVAWAGWKYPPCVVNFLDNADEAQGQVLEIASLLQLPILEPSLLDDPRRLRSRWR